MNYDLEKFCTDLLIIKQATVDWGKSTKDGYDLRYVSIPKDLRLPLAKVIASVGQFLITTNGQTNISTTIALEKIGIKHKVLERDSFGPLICAIYINKGFICYG
jgi:hypothetical protein